MKTRSSVKLFCFGLLLPTLNPQLSTLLAQVPSIISYQGRVQAGGTNFSGTGQFKFALVSPGTNVSRQATAAAAVTSGFITAINVIDGGGGYQSAPAVVITDSTGSGAAAVAQVSGGVVTNITVQNAGSGYSSSPTVSIAPPPLTIVHGTFWSNDGTSSTGSEPASAVAVPVQQGLFTVFLGDTNLPNMQPVPADVFTQHGAHLRIWFSDGVNGFTQLVPDQRVGSVGYAMRAAQVSAGGVNGAALSTGSVTSATIENGSILVEDLNLSLLNGAFWNLSGNSGTTPGTHFLGTTDNQPLEFKVNGTRALRLEPKTDNQPNVVGGSALNFVAPGIVGATIAGGGTENESGGGIARSNSVMADFGSIGGGLGNRTASGVNTIAGGYLNDIGINAAAATIGGGYRNNITNNGFFSTIAGGQNNIVHSGYSTIAGGRDNDIGAQDSVIGGGENNSIATLSGGSTIAGGTDNNIGTSSGSSTIGGGNNNSIGANSQYATIPGGRGNFATNYAFAAGRGALANHVGSFVWADSGSLGLTGRSTNANSVTIVAAGGYRLFSNNGLPAVGVYLAPSGGSWTTMSDRDAKENFEPVNSRGVLDKVAALPMSTWNYKSQTNSVRHIGPMAQDFKAAFGLGETDTGITTVDADGVALAAIQGLNQKLEAGSQRSEVRSQQLETRSRKLEERLQQKETEITELKQTVNELKELVQTMNHKLNGGAQ